MYVVSQWPEEKVPARVTVQKVKLTEAFCELTGRYRYHSYHLYSERSLKYESDRVSAFWRVGHERLNNCIPRTSF